MKTTVFKLHFNQPLHIGANHPGFEHTEDIIRSDTLFSAVVNAWRLLFPEDMETFFPETSDEELDFSYFQISSAFPFCGECLYFPKLQWRMGKVGVDDPDIAKQIKKLTFLEKPLFEMTLNGNTLDVKSVHSFGNGRFWSESDISDNYQPITIVDVPRIVKDRITEATSIFYFSRVYFNKGAGLFFLAEFENEECKEKFIAALRLLGDEGIGGDRSVGNGQFAVEDPRVIDLNTPADVEHFITLSLYHPKEQELASILQEASYGLITRRGWVHSVKGTALRRKSVRMFAEGSVFKDNGNIRGNLVKVLDKMPESGLNHNVYRYGLPFCLPFKPPEVDDG